MCVCDVYMHMSMPRRTGRLHVTCAARTPSVRMRDSQCNDVMMAMD